MRVALSMRIVQASGYEEPRDAISHDWLNRLSSWNMTPILIPNGFVDSGKYLAEMTPDILLLTGGDDLGATPLRDQIETMLFEAALKSKLPVLGVCRGLQFVNDYFDGRLSSVDGHVAKNHAVQVRDPWQGIYGTVFEANSYHAQGIHKDALGSGLVTAASDDQGFVEAAYHKDHAVAGVMWHPERKDAVPGDEKLVRRLATKGAFWQ